MLRCSRSCPATQPVFMIIHAACVDDYSVSRRPITTASCSVCDDVTGYDVSSVQRRTNKPFNTYMSFTSDQSVLITLALSTHHVSFNTHSFNTAQLN